MADETASVEPIHLSPHRALSAAVERWLTIATTPDRFARLRMGHVRGLPAATEADRLACMETRLTRITANPKICSGQACVRGLRIPVSVVLKHLAAGKTAAEVVDEFPELELGDIGECLLYAAWLASGRTIELPSAAA